MIHNMRDFWERMTKILAWIDNHTNELKMHWPTEMPSNLNALGECDSRLQDLKQAVVDLDHEFIWLRGHQEAVEGRMDVTRDLAMASTLVDALKLLGQRFQVIFQFQGQNLVRVISEKPNENGDVILEITPRTAPTSEIANSLGVTIEKINGARRRLGIKPAGWVSWRLANGIEPEPAGSYSLLQWRQFRDDLQPNGTVTPPDRLIDDDDL